MKHFFLTLFISLTLLSCKQNIKDVKSISLAIAQDLPVAVSKNNIKTERVILESNPKLITYTPKGVEIISTADNENTRPVHIFRKNAYTTLSLRELAITNEREAKKYMKDILEYTAQNVKRHKNGFYYGESKGPFQQAKLLKSNGRFYIWMVDCLSIEKDEFLPTVDVIVNNTQFIE